MKTAVATPQVTGTFRLSRAIRLTVDKCRSPLPLLDGYGRGKPENGDGTFRLTLGENSTVHEVIQGMGVPSDRVAMTMINGRRCQVEAGLKPGDRIILIPSDVAALWRALGVQNMGMESVFDF